MTNLEKRKQRFLEGQTVKKEQMNTLEKLEECKTKLRSQELKSQEHLWFNHQPRFLIDGERAYTLLKNKEKVQDYNIENDDFAIIDMRREPQEKSANQQILLSDVISVDRLIELTGEQLKPKSTQ